MIVYGSVWMRIREVNKAFTCAKKFVSSKPILRKGGIILTTSSPYTSVFKEVQNKKTLTPTLGVHVSHDILLRFMSDSSKVKVFWIFCIYAQVSGKQNIQI